jgi:hypothetical protein
LLEKNASPANAKIFVHSKDPVHAGQTCGEMVFLIKKTYIAAGIQAAWPIKAVIREG